MAWHDENVITQKRLAVSLHNYPTKFDDTLLICVEMATIKIKSTIFVPYIQF